MEKKTRPPGESKLSKYRLRLEVPDLRLVDANLHELWAHPGAEWTHDGQPMGTGIPGRNAALLQMWDTSRNALVAHLRQMDAEAPYVWRILRDAHRVGSPRRRGGRRMRTESPRGLPIIFGNF